MRKRVLAFALVICLLFGVMPMSANAASNSSTASTTVYYTVDSYYEVVIPSAINLNEEDGFQFSATSCSLPSGKVLYIAVDREKTFDGGTYFCLFQNKGLENEKKIACYLRVSSSKEDMSYTEIKGSPGSSQIVAVFQNGNLNPILRGYLRFHCSPSSNTPAGTYSGQIYFNIYLDDPSHYTENS